MVATTKPLIQPNAQNQYDVTLDDLPLSCPMPEMYLWNSHPRVYLPILLGVLFGWVLREILKTTRFSQRLHLPTLLVLLCIVLPIGAAFLEASLRLPASIEGVSTEIVQKFSPLRTIWVYGN